MVENLFYRYPIGFKIVYGIINALSTCSPDIKLFYRINIFEKPEQTVFTFACTECVQSKNRVDLVEASIFYKSKKTSGQTVRLMKIKTVSLFYLIMAA